MEWDGLWYESHRDVYDPSDDTFLLAATAAAATKRGDRFLEIGCGAGIVAMAAARTGAQVTVTDRNPLAVRLAVSNARQNRLHLDAIVGDLASAAQAGTFDVIAFNPPYLPTADDEHVEGPLDWAFDGGASGNEVILRLAADIGRLAPRAAFVVHSSLSDPAPLDEAMEAAGYSASIAAREKFPFEQLTVRRYDRR